ncbi:lysyl-tRNA synthetase [Infirmifilum uzonense]|uniref:Lysine--tRNA ligase n=1 Tax=Infirmifilum uzonense TaxID=1550241 RepID=A0A0F7CL59_9CREN|nr:lysine--tRNA ligase [Infirmifilum uzonense]AKG38841.1 lysyl-tRNA synthetase [Infirmifilum uzonense]
MHWTENVARQLLSITSKEDVIVGNGGLSVSGLQHVGRLRGEITIVDTVLRITRKLSGKETRHLLTLYTVDSWKGKEGQLKQFKDVNEARSYTGWPLYRVPDPHGCHDNWVDHYWEEFGSYLNRFAEDVKVVTTKELYENNDRMKEFVLLSLTTHREKVIETINKYRGEKKLGKDSFPFQPICDKCGRIDTTEVVEVDPANYRARYVCKHCGNEGWQSLTKGKLNWRVEWVGVWYSLKVMFEPYGKDHATPGGSRDSCNDLARNVYGFEPPLGLAYEWVGYRTKGRDVGDMGSSDFIGFSPKAWIEVAEPEILRFIYLISPPMRRVVLSLEEVPSYYDNFDKAERVFFGLEEGEEDVAESYRLSLLHSPPKEPPFQLRYLTAMILAQVLPSGGRDTGEVLQRLRETKQLNRDLHPWELERIKTRISLARRWLELYAPEYYRISIVPEPPTKEITQILDASTAGLLRELASLLESLDSWNEDSIKNVMMGLKKDKELEKKLFTTLYLVFFGRPSGPRIAPYLAMLNKDFVVTRLRQASSLIR